MIKPRIGISVASVLAVLMAGGHAAAQQAGGAADGMEEIVIRGKASRLPDSLTTFPGSVTRLDVGQIESQLTFGNDPSQLLGQLVPGLGTSAPASASNFEQTLRGRKAAILIDGVPIGTPLRDGRHDIRSLSLTAIESVEVIRGATALYGNGGVGGVINYITKRGASGRPQFLSEVGTRVSLTHVDDSLAPFVHQAALGAVGNVDFNLDAYYEKTNSFFDADGNRIRPSPNGQGGIAESDIVNMFGKVGVNFAGAQRLEGSVLFYRQQQDSVFNVLIPGDPANDIPAQVARGPAAPGAIGPLNKNLLLTGTYEHGDLFGSALRLQGYYQEFRNVFDYGPSFFPGGGQSQILSDKWGVRLDVTTPIDIGNLVNDGTILWGADFLNDETGQSLVDGRVWATPVDQQSIAGFLQATIPLGSWFSLSGGLRHEEIDISFDGFTALFSGETVQPGETDYSATTFNVGANVQIIDSLNAYASFSQGFSVAEVGRVLRQAGELTEFSLAELEASIVDGYEVGLRFASGAYSATVSGFYTTSNLGTTVTTDLRIRRQEEETFGVEIAVDAEPSDDWQWGASFTWVGGNRDTDDDGRVDRPLPSNVVPPAKVTAYVAHSFNDMWSSRVQVLHSAGRNKFETITAFGEAPIKSFTLVDLSVRADFGRAGALTLGISNLLNEDYFTIASRLFNDATRFSKGPGTGARLAYSITY